MDDPKTAVVLGKHRERITALIKNYLGVIGALRRVTDRQGCFPEPCRFIKVGSFDEIRGSRLKPYGFCVAVTVDRYLWE